MSEPAAPSQPIAETTTASAPPTEPAAAPTETVKLVEQTSFAPSAGTTEAAPATSAPESAPAAETAAPLEKAPEATPETAESVSAPISTEEPSKEIKKKEVHDPLPINTATGLSPLKGEVHDPIPVITATGPTWPSIAKNHPLSRFQSMLPDLLKQADHNLIWGVTLSAEEPIPFHTTLILQKFLRGYGNNVDVAYNQLLETLKWRKVYRPEAAMEEFFSEDKFGGLGYVTKTKTKDGEKIITYNIYGACKDPKKTFGNLDR